MVKCSSCLLTNDIRYTRPPGVCESCHTVTPYQDKLCSSCSEAQQVCQCCRSKRVTALIAVPTETVPLLDALAAAQQQQKLQQRAHSLSQSQSQSLPPTQRLPQTQSTPRQEEEKQQISSTSNLDSSLSVTQPETRLVSTSAASTALVPAGSPRRSPATTAPIHPHTLKAATSYLPLATSPFHFQNSTTYELPPSLTRRQDSTTDLNATMPASSSQATTVRFDPNNYLSELPPENESLSQSLSLISLQQQQLNGISTSQEMMLPEAGAVILSPSGKLIPATLTPLSPLMAAQHNIRGRAPTIRDESDARTLVESWTKPELISHVFHYYCNHKATKIVVQLHLGKFRHFAMDAGLIGPANASIGATALSPNRLDILYTQCTRPLSGQKQHMNESQFFEVLGSIALWRYGGGNAGLIKPTKLVPCLDKLFEHNLVPLAIDIVQARRGGMFLRMEEFEPIVNSVFLRYEESLKKIFVRIARQFYADVPRADETLTHPLIEDGWKAFCREYDFFPTNISVTSMIKIFMATASGIVRNGQLDKQAQSFDDFLHGLYQLAQISFTLTPNAAPIERVELLMSKIDSKARELDYMPIGQRAKMASLPAAMSENEQRMLVSTTTDSGGQLIPYKGEQEMQANSNGAYDSLYSLFTSTHMACARDLFNLYCNTASQTSYSEILPRIQWVRMLRESNLIDGHHLVPADPDILFNKVLANSQHSSATSLTATAFVHGRSLVFPLYLTALLEVATKRFPSYAATAALRTMFTDALEPLLQAKIKELHHQQEQIELPLGAGLNSAGVINPAPGNWGAGHGAWKDTQNSQQLLLTSSDSPSSSSADQPTSPTLYPNHPSQSPVTTADVPQLLATDPEIQTLLQSYTKVLERIFFRASWEGIEAQNGVSIPRISSSLLIHSSPSATLSNQLSWDQFLQQKNLLSEHAFRRWCALMKIVPDLVAHKQITMLFREGNIGFDRTQNQFVMNYSEFQATLLRIALLCFSGNPYIAYSTPASKLELLFFLLDQNSNGALGFKGFKFMPAATKAAPPSKSNDTALLMAATNMGHQLWERKLSNELGVRALLMGEAPTTEQGDREAAASRDGVMTASTVDVPQEWGHGGRGPHGISTRSHVVPPIRNFTTFLRSPRQQFATHFRPPTSTTAQEAQFQNEPSASPTKMLFQQTPFPVKEGTVTKFSANVPSYAMQPLKGPRIKQIERQRRLKA